MANKYQNIINLPHYELKYHKRMQIEDRAKEFAPFAALTSFDDRVKETERLTSKKHLLDNNRIDLLNNKLLTLNNSKEKSLVKIIYFVKDSKKDGGEYLTYLGYFKRIDSTNHVLIFDNNLKISFEDIYDLEIIS